jgi:phosphoribosylformylglycinamidine synthase
LLGGEGLSLWESECQKVMGDIPLVEKKNIAAPVVNWKKAKEIYQFLGGEKQRYLNSIHDLSEGGLLVALSESLMASGLGLEAQVPKSVDPWHFAFAEGFHSFVVSVAPENQEFVEKNWNKNGISHSKLGTLSESNTLSLTDGRQKLEFLVKDLYESWSHAEYWD